MMITKGPVVGRIARAGVRSVVVGAAALAFVAGSVRESSAQAAQTPPDTVRLTLEDAVARGLAASHRIEELSARGDAARAVSDQRHAALLPRVNAQAGYTRTNHVEVFGVLLPNNQLRILYPDEPDNYRTRADLQWPLYTGGRLQALERAARIEVAASASDLDAVRSDLQHDIARAYWSLVAAAETMRVVDRSLEQVGAHLVDARNRLDAGLVAPHEVLSVEAQQARQQTLKIQVTSRRDVAEAVLARLVGLVPGTGIEPVSTLEAPASPGTRFEDLLQTARDHRADRRALSERVAAARERTQAASNGRKPNLAVGGGVDFARPNPRIFPREGAWQESWDASLNVDWPLFDGGRAKAEAAEADAGRRAAEARLAELDSLLALEIRQRLSERESSRAAIVSAETGIRAAVEAQRVVGERYAAGVAIGTDVLDAQVAILQAELDRTDAMTSLRLAEAGLARAVGR
jgi:outer membrane protein TolC